MIRVYLSTVAILAVGLASVAAGWAYMVLLRLLGRTDRALDHDRQAEDALLGEVVRHAVREAHHG